jgi:hypothetical protein
VEAIGQPEVAFLGQVGFDLHGGLRVRGGGGILRGCLRIRRGSWRRNRLRGGQRGGCLLGEGHALDGEEFLGVDGPCLQWANRVQPSNSKRRNWWQSPLCSAFRYPTRLAEHQLH